MQRRADLPLRIRRRFLTGRLALDLVHTGGEGEYAAWELIHGPDDLSRWLGVILDLDEVHATATDLPVLRRLRGAVARAAHAAAAGRIPSPDDVATINIAATAPPLTPSLRPDGTRTYARPTAAAALSTLARDAIELFSSPLAERIRICAAPDCGLLFVDNSRPGRRRWCSMQRCGNLAKVRNYRHGQAGEQ
jgi:predicted RNA-binding Zn ribbon-like protein